jgi:hypothetical protein
MDHAITPATPREGSPITDRLTTTSYTNFTIDDTLALFLQAMAMQPTHHSITLSPEHVIKCMWRPHTPYLPSSISYHSYNIHPCFALRGTAALVQLFRTAELTKTNKHIIKTANIKCNTNVKKQITDFPFHTQIAAHFPNSHPAFFAYDLTTSTGPTTVTTEATINKINIIIKMMNLIYQNTLKHTLIAADAFSRTQNDTALPHEFRVAAIATLTSTLMTRAALSAQTLSFAQWAIHSIPLMILQATTYEDLENVMEAGYADLPTLHTSTPQPTFFVDACFTLALYLIYLVLSHLYTLCNNSHPNKITTTPQHLSGPHISQPQASHSQHLTKKRQTEAN